MLPSFVRHACDEPPPPTRARTVAGERHPVARRQRGGSTHALRGLALRVGELQAEPCVSVALRQRGVPAGIVERLTEPVVAGARRRERERQLQVEVLATITR